MYTRYAIRNNKTGAYYKFGYFTTNTPRVKTLHPTASLDDATARYSKNEAIFFLVEKWEEFSKDGDTFEIVEFKTERFIQGSKAKIQSVHMLDMDKIKSLAKIVQLKNLNGYCKKTIISYLHDKKNGYKTKYIVLITGEKVNAKDFPFRRGSFYAMQPNYDGRYIFLLDADQLMLVRLTYSNYKIINVEE